MVYIGGPFHGMKWRYDDTITHIQLGFNSCYCRITANPFTTPVTLGTSGGPVTFVSESSIADGVFDAAVDPCKSPVNRVSSGGSLFSLNSNGEGEFYSTDPSLVGVNQDATISSLAGTATTIAGESRVFLSFRFDPACAYS